MGRPIIQAGSWSAKGLDVRFRRLNIQGRAMGCDFMKKGHGRFAHVIALSELIMGSGLEGCTQALRACCRECDAGNLRPAGRYLWRAAKGLTSRSTNTDAEGGFILADAACAGLRRRSRTC